MYKNATYGDLGTIIKTVTALDRLFCGCHHDTVMPNLHNRVIHNQVLHNSALYKIYSLPFVVNNCTYYVLNNSITHALNCVLPMYS